MFENLSQNITKIFNKIKGSAIITESNIDEALREVRIALLEADVSIQVVKDFLDSVKEKAIGTEVLRSISPGEMIVKIIHDEMVNLLSPDAEEAIINLSASAPVNLLVVGLQGSGKTTSSAKLAAYLKKSNKKTLLVSLDIYRPAAQEQLAILAKNVGVDSLEIVQGQKPLDIVSRSISYAKLNAYDVVIYDSAGRLHVDEEMISEALSVKKIIKPTETLLVIDAMIGQDAINVISQFHSKLDITGTILTRIDGDSRGGVALSARRLTGRPVKFLSTGEKPGDFEAFDAKRVAGRILGMGDIVSFVEKASEVLNKEEAEKALAKMQKGRFDLNDYAKQISMMQKMGGVTSIMKMIPGASALADKVSKNFAGDNVIKQQYAIICSMTKKEKKNPNLLNASRRKRIAEGSGTTVQNVNQLLKQYENLAVMFKKASKMNPAQLMSGLKNLGLKL